MGVDHIKMRTTPDLATFEAVADEAARHHLPLAAHPVGTPQEMMRARLRSVEHLLAFPPLNTLPLAERRSLFQEMKNSGMFMSDTVVNLRGSVLLSYAEAKSRLNDVSGKIDPHRKYVCGYLVDDWREQVEEKKGEENAIEAFRKEMPGILRDLRGMREANVPFLAGTDVGVAFMYPGISLHDELEAEVHDLGFSPMEVLRNATYNPHAFYRDKQEQGAIAKGQAADLVLLNGDPLSDIRNTRLMEGVIVHGEWLDRAALDGLLARTVGQAEGNCGTERR
jgi:imidazolonepropionase-like amidohydrolase